jgi:tetraacyldisaccharide 4'-kinase
VDITGDEAQMLVRDGDAHLGVSVDRLAAGRAIERRFRPGLFLLDDGFQHTGVYKDMEIVMLDGLDPFAGGFVFPRGRLRGPVSELARADAIVIARAGGRPLDGVHRVIRSVNPHAPVYHAELKPLYWTDLVTGARHPAETFSGRTVACFCGLANPESFRRTLETLGCRIISFDAFPDHHRYSRAEIEALLRRARDSGAEQLVTTEKDAVKLGNTPLYYLSVGLSVDQELLRIVQTKAKVTIA